ncbi:MAG: hypothetical protein A2600_05715 [Candidatus Lambdaproteobacteria bacterium RIFOXYD1_FULL_56_27]|uniref:UvrABC system protein C n=1 Tax=Candidatus Lambdaproteobacteria bacterium RIFOXYD2_FULL_56_26 TaxID=1817773 RepID=A0A1F6GR94_9PROT|nr:MAG: hypothetical protein A2426_10920 [Candidatus Lambdaproteobacteria bacterium RIFOXYC1_FULL_56_13]OGH00696.1 MAG: hypothetical protein A2557_03420 [Candidatus Lambdaproteobacteria bacterium RIFOXYD2_FULL_56_26]OGH07863.1 MAG: hypothetical protein A2600_05715 [Candidatus Lambdaproteobacteria bacterium RIFOXYD1_FULL_56_27]
MDQTSLTQAQQKLELLPDEPGVYRFLDGKGKIIYIGKAKNLKKRVKSYFTPRAAVDPRIVALVPMIKDLAWIVTKNEIEALILENQMIKTHRPKYNVELKDDKTYPYFRLTVGELFPRLSLVRNPKKDRALYFGPYVAVRTAREALATIRRFFPLRQSKMELDGSKTYKPCLNFQLKRCLAPCSGQVAVEEYGKLVEKVVWLLKGNYEELLKQLQSEMQKRSEAMRFEEAAALRDQIRSLERTFTKQQVLSKERIDRDILSLVRQGGFAGVEVLFVRGGILLSDDFLFFKEGGLYSDQELLRAALTKLYFAGEKPLPKEILLPEVNDDILILEEYFSIRRESKVTILNPQRGDKLRLLEMATRNGEENLKQRLAGAQAEEQILAEVQNHLHLTRSPVRAECFDISNLMGKHSVASMVVFENGKPLKSDYRIFKIKTVEGPNDFASMEEVLTRRYGRLLEEGGAWPDLIIIDGGLGQLNSAIRILTGLGVNLETTDLIGLAKGRSEKAKDQKRKDRAEERPGSLETQAAPEPNREEQERRDPAGEDSGDLEAQRPAPVAPGEAGHNPEEDFEYVVKPNRKNPIPLRKNSSPLFFLQRIRDEAHRFAITHHRKLRGKAAVKSSLEDIPGIGPKKRAALLKHFGSLQALESATPDQLAQVPGLGPKDVVMLTGYFEAG